jgi:hypothetical protein
LLINCLDIGSHTDRNDAFTGLGFRDWKKQEFTGKGSRIVRVNTFANNFFGMWFYRKIEDFTFV